MRYSRGQHRGLEVLEEGDGGDMNRSFKYQNGTEVKRQRPGGSKGQKRAASAGQSCGVLEETRVVVLAGVHEKVKSRGPNQGKMMMKIRQMMVTATAYPINRAEEVQDENVGEMLEQDNEGERQFLKGRGNKAGKKPLGRTELEWKKWKVMSTPGQAKCYQGNPAGWGIIDASWSPETEFVQS
ncbi:hypothetical protein EDC04DRAFT_2612101 [Pisolithus marmoratus]|nr:hypothetical protein EDC04DRAFT_2612101 [Pisolithus marmoratus]